jgi:menaquinone-9 beta-reductase
VLRGARVTGVTPGKRASVHFERDNREETTECRLVAAADGRNAGARAWGEFPVCRDEERLQIAGVLLDGMGIPDDTANLTMNVSDGGMTLLFPQGKGRVRSYCVLHTGSRRFQGEKDLPAYLEACARVGLPREVFDGAEASGPLATFDGADSFVPHPYRSGIALIGDAAATSDPSWGQGLSLTLKDARVLRDHLLADDDWDAAGHAYADEHDRYFANVHAITGWFTQFIHTPGPDAMSRRTSVMTSDPEIIDQLDIFQCGPDHIVPAEEARVRLLGE